MNGSTMHNAFYNLCKENQFKSSQDICFDTQLFIYGISYRLLILDKLILLKVFTILVSSKK